ESGTSGKKPAASADSRRADESETRFREIEIDSASILSRFGGSAGADDRRFVLGFAARCAGSASMTVNVDTPASAQGLGLGFLKTVSVSRRISRLLRPGGTCKSMFRTRFPCSNGGNGSCAVERPDPPAQKP